MAVCQWPGGWWCGTGAFLCSRAKETGDGHAGEDHGSHWAEWNALVVNVEGVRGRREGLIDTAGAPTCSAAVKGLTFRPSATRPCAPE